MEKKDIDWSGLGFGYVKTDKRYVANFKNGAWDEGGLTEDADIVMNECAGVLQYAQTCFEGLKAYTTEDGRTVCFRPDLNAERMYNTAQRLEMPPFPKERFIDAVKQVVKANEAWVPPYGSGAPRPASGQSVCRIPAGWSQRRSPLTWVPCNNARRSGHQTHPQLP